MSDLPSPMLASPSTSAGNRQPFTFEELMGTGDWLADVKVDGIRAYAILAEGFPLQLVNRNGVDITRKYPELVESARAGDLEPGWYDGEIVCESGSFEATLTRDKQESAAAILKSAISDPARFVAFDLPGVETSYSERRAVLDKLKHLDGRFTRTVVSDSTGFLQRTRDLGLEGVIVKRKASRYEFGRRSRSWVKFKNLHRISCLVSGYTSGTGSRSEFGAMELVLVGADGELVPCGTVGSGFTLRQCRDLKARLDRAEVLVVEIECLNVTPAGKLRFPVYKGIRTDVEPIECTITQLKTIPTC